LFGGNNHREMVTKPGLPFDGAAALVAHGRWLRTVILARTGELAAVDDVFQEVALALSKQQARHSAIALVEPFLYRLAVRQSLLYRRKAGRQRRLRTRWAERNLHSDEDRVEPGEWLLAMELRQSVRDALQTLISKDREILLLKYTEDWSYHQLAAHLGISHSAVEARLHRARERLRSQLIQTIASERH
jgi:RNA polymerase sigma-70 factor (ECF subfamily)